MSDDWRNWHGGTRGVSVGQLADGEQATFVGVGEPFRQDTSMADDVLHVPVRVGDAPDGFADIGGDPIDPEETYNIISSSGVFFDAFVQAFPSGDAVTGAEFVVFAHQADPDDPMSRTYEIGVDR